MCTPGNILSGQMLLQRVTTCCGLTAIKHTESVGVTASLLPRAGRVGVKVWACRVGQASPAETLLWGWEWRTTGVEKSAHTCFCQSSP